MPNFGALLTAVIKAGVTIIGIACIYGAIKLYKTLSVNVNPYTKNITIGGRTFTFDRPDRETRQALRQARRDFDAWNHGAFDGRMGNAANRERVRNALEYGSRRSFRSKTDRIREDMSR